MRAIEGQAELAQKCMPVDAPEIAVPAFLETAERQQLLAEQEADVTAGGIGDDALAQVLQRALVVAEEPVQVRQRRDDLHFPRVARLQDTELLFRLGKFTEALKALDEVEMRILQARIKLHVALQSLDAFADAAAIAQRHAERIVVLGVAPV